ncbi:MAG: hypothetical protein PQJ46_14105, partial [Spirochaetales bacterium]|nr:hypothetical protein [Spirochaetales bacterium]
VYLSMECISPRMIPNLEVNDSLTTILTQMTAKEAAPPMMHDFFLASLLPAVFHSEDPNIIARIFEKISEFDVPHDSIRFSLSESHDGKSVRGSLDLLTFKERMVLTKAVKANGGFVKYKSVPCRKSLENEVKQFSDETGIDFSKLKASFFDEESDGNFLKLKDEIKTFEDISSNFSEMSGKILDISDFFFTRILEGRDPYELCITTRDSLPVLEDEQLSIDRFLAFETLAFAIMGRNVKTIYFNDLLALANDYKKAEETGELRNIKRTKIDFDELLPKLQDSESFEARISQGINNLIALVDSDPALHYRGAEAELVPLSENIPVAVIKNNCGKDSSITVVNLSSKTVNVEIPCEGMSFNNITGKDLSNAKGFVKTELMPYERLWLTERAVSIPEEKLV